MFHKKSTVEHITIAEGSLTDFSNYYCDGKFMKTEFEKLVAQRKLVPFFALSNGKMIGKIYFVTQTRDLQVADGKQIGYICNLFVKKPFRNFGIGTRLVDTVKDYAKSNGFCSLTIGVEENNEKNMHLYRKLGFAKKVKNLNIDLLFKDAEGKDITVNEYAVYRCDL